MQNGLVGGCHRDPRAHATRLLGAFVCCVEPGEAGSWAQPGTPTASWKRKETPLKTLLVWPRGWWMIATRRLTFLLARASAPAAWCAVRCCVQQACGYLPTPDPSPPPPPFPRLARGIAFFLFCKNVRVVGTMFATRRLRGKLFSGAVQGPYYEGGWEVPCLGARL
jgi:hypothetical protein